MKPIARTAALAVVLLLALAHTADAAFHLMLIAEVYPGSYANTAAQYVMLRSTAANQNLLTNHPIMTFNADGSQGPNFGNFTSNSANTSLGARYIMMTPAAQTFFGMQADGIATGRMPFPSGRICFAPLAGGGFVDCVAYGAYTGDNTGYGQPAPALERQKALTRITFNSTVRNNASDFVLDPSPQPTNDDNITSPDSDADGVPDSTDCADNDSSLFLVPLEVANLLVRRTPGPSGPTTDLAWDDQALLTGLGMLSDVVAGEQSEVPAAAHFSTAFCLHDNLAATAATDALPDPPPGVLRYYLARGQNGCGTGTYGNGSGAVDPRDVLDDPATTPCP